MIELDQDFNTFSMVSAHHDKKNIPITILKLTSRLTKEYFKELMTELKKLDYYYSRAQKGIVFETTPDNHSLQAIEKTLNNFKKEQKTHVINKVQDYKKLYAFV